MECTNNLAHRQQVVTDFKPVVACKMFRGGAFVSSQQPDQSEVDRVISKFHDGPNVKVGRCETQVWGVPWTEDDFVQQMVKFGYPATLKSALPDILTETVEFYRRTPAHERAEYRASRLGFWLRKMVELKADEQKLKAAMDPDVALILKSKNILLWEEMLAMTGYKDMGVVQEFKEGTDLVGCTPRLGCGLANSNQPPLRWQSCMTSHAKSEMVYMSNSLDLPRVASRRGVAKNNGGG